MTKQILDLLGRHRENEWQKIELEFVKYKYKTIKTHIFSSYYIRSANWLSIGFIIIMQEVIKSLQFHSLVIKCNGF